MSEFKDEYSIFSDNPVLMFAAQIESDIISKYRIRQPVDQAQARRDAINYYIAGYAFAVIESYIETASAYSNAIAQALKGDWTQIIEQLKVDARLNMVLSQDPDTNKIYESADLDSEEKGVSLINLAHALQA